MLKQINETMIHNYHRNDDNAKNKVKIMHNTLEIS